jgi:hypothetical protein
VLLALVVRGPAALVLVLELAALGLVSAQELVRALVLVSAQALALVLVRGQVPQAHLPPL